MPNSQSDTARRDTLTSADAGVVASMLDLDRRARALERGVGGLLPRPRRVCMLSVHSCPLAAPGGKETGGMNVYVRELSRQLGRRGYLVDNYTRSESPDVPHILDTDLGPNVRVIHVVAGPEQMRGGCQTIGSQGQHAFHFATVQQALDRVSQCIQSVHLTPPLLCPRGPAPGSGR